jgi:hypothetical protein
MLSFVIGLHLTQVKRSSYKYREMNLVLLLLINVEVS